MSLVECKALLPNKITRKSACVSTVIAPISLQCTLKCLTLCFTVDDPTQALWVWDSSIFSEQARQQILVYVLYVGENVDFVFSAFHDGTSRFLLQLMQRGLSCIERSV